MVEGKFVRGKQSKKSLFTRLTEKLTSQSHCPTRDQSVQTSLNPSAMATVLLNHRLNVTPSSRPRLSLRTFLLAYSPKSIPFKSRARRRSTNIKTSKGTTSHSLVIRPTFSDVSHRSPDCSSK